MAKTRQLDETELKERAVEMIFLAYSEVIYDIPDAETGDLAVKTFYDNGLYFSDNFTKATYKNVPARMVKVVMDVGLPYKVVGSDVVYDLKELTTRLPASARVVGV